MQYFTLNSPKRSMSFVEQTLSIGCACSAYFLFSTVWLEQPVEWGIFIIIFLSVGLVNYFLPQGANESLTIEL